MHQLAMFEDGLSERNRIIEAMRASRPAYAAALTEFAVALAAQNGTVNVDQLRIKIASIDFPMPADVDADERIFGSVFPRRLFEPIGRVATQRTEFAKRVGVARSSITVYRLRDVA